MATSVSFVFMRFLLSGFLLSLCLPCSPKKGYAFEEREKTAESFVVQTFQFSSLFASSVCNHSTKANERSSTFKIVDKYGPCFQPNRHRAASPSHANNFSFDRFRVNYIHSKLAKNSGHRDTIKTNSVSIPAKDGEPFQTSNFVVTVGFGTPKKDLSLVFDTGSDLTWTQCEPCLNCYRQREPMFDRTQSSTYVNISNTDTVCKYVQRPANVPSNFSSLCVYEVEYADDAITIGLFAKETLTLSSDKINGFLFGCGYNQTGDFDLEAGILGLNQEQASIVMQTATKYKQFFSYCLPSSTASIGHLTFGSHNLPSNITYAPLVAKKSPYYGLDLIGIGLGGVKLNITQSVFTTPGTVIDSGTAFTYLPSTAYPTFRSAFRQAMSAYPMGPPHTADGLDTCYDFSKNSTVTVPEISFFFEGGTVVNMPGKSALTTYTTTQVCLGFANFTSSGVNEIIIGNQVQRTMEVVYDIPGKRIGFAPGGC